MHAGKPGATDSRSCRLLTRDVVSKLALVLFACELASAKVHASEAVSKNDRPNIVVILVDDMGFSDIGCYGGEIPTPHLDQLAEQGLRYSQFYNTGRCCPTRASLLTGLYSHQTGIGHMTADDGVPGYRGFLNRHCVTIADVARSAGYFTAMTGKWHVGSGKDDRLPRARGFDRFYGIPEGGGFYIQLKKGRTIRLNDEVVASIENPLPEGWYSTDAWTEYGLKFVDEAIQADKPFLLYVAHNAPHFPLQADAKEIERFRGKYKLGWDHLAKERFERQVEMGFIDESWGQADRPSKVSPWSELSAQDQDRMDHQMAAYAACVAQMDRAVGELVEGLRERGQLDNTVLFFMSDNGGCAEGGVLGKNIGDPTTAASNWYCGMSWAWMQDTPFRKFKHYNHEGGIATPLIVHWPNGLEAKNEWRSQVTHVIDLMPTIVELTGGVYPERSGEKEIYPLSGKSMVDSMVKNQPLERNAIFWEHEGNAAIRLGKWKLVRQGKKGAWELYDLEKDRTELQNLADQFPQRAKRMAAQWKSWAETHQVVPRRRPKEKPSAKL